MATPTSPDWPGDGPGVFISAEAHARLVERIGSSATTAFIAVALDAAPDERGALVTSTSARSLARQLHVAKDTAAGVLGLLVRRGYLRRLAQPRIGGRFAPARYAVKPPVGFTVVPCPVWDDTAPSPITARASAPASPGCAPPRAPRSHRDKPSQLGLFAAAPRTTDPRSPG